MRIFHENPIRYLTCRWNIIIQELRRGYFDGGAVNNRRWVKNFGNLLSGRQYLSPLRGRSIDVPICGTMASQINDF